MELEFGNGEIIKVVWALDYDTPAALFNFSPNAGARIRGQLRMKDDSRTKMSNDALAPFFDPSATSEKRKRVIIILEQVSVW